MATKSEIQSGLVELGQQLGDLALEGQIQGAILITFPVNVGMLNVFTVGINELQAMGALDLAKISMIQKVTRI